MGGGPTLEVLTKRVGEGGQTAGVEVLRVEQLLRLAGYGKLLGPPNKKWTAKSAAAMTAFQTDLSKVVQCPVHDYVEPEDTHSKLVHLAMKAGVVSVVPGFSRGRAAVLSFYDGIVKQVIPYGWTENGTPIRGGTRMVWGWAGMSQFVVYTRPGTDPARVEFRTDYPKTLNCSAFANLMLSVWLTGGAHAAPYTPLLNVGAMKPLGARYNMPPLKGNVSPDNSQGVFSDLGKLKEQLLPSKIYHFARYVAGFGIKHDMVLLDGVVYESNKKPDGVSSVYSTPLDEKFKALVKKKGQYAQVLGPAAG